MATEAATLSVGIEVDMGDLEKSLEGIDKKLQGFGKKMESVGKDLTKFVTLPILGIGTGMAAAVMELEASEAKYNTVFDGMTDEADAFIKKFKELTPATTAEARNMASGIQDLLVPMGFMREDATELTGELFHLIGALTNFNSGTHSAEQVASAFQSALLGQYQPLASLGIQLSKSEVEARALAMGLADTSDELTKQHLALAMAEMAYEQSGDALAAYTFENLDAKTKMGLMKAEAIDVAASFGEVMLPTINKVIDGMRAAIEWFGGFTEEQQKLIIIVGAVVAAIGPMLIVMAKLIEAFTVVKPVIIAASAAIGAISAPVAIAIAAVVALIAIGVALYKNWDTVMEWAGKLKDYLINTWENIKTGVSGRVTAVKDSISEGISNALDFVKGMASDFMEAGKGLVESITDGIKSMAMKPVDAVKDMAGRIRNMLPFSPAKEGPLKDLDKLDFGGPIVSSIRHDIGDVRGAMGDMLTPSPAGAGTGGGGSANIYFDVDGRTMAKIIGQPLTDEIRLKTGMRL